MPQLVRRLAPAVLVVLVAGCGSEGSEPGAEAPPTTAGAESTSTTAVEVVSDVVDIGDGRTLYHREGLWARGYGMPGATTPPS